MEMASKIELNVKFCSRKTEIILYPFQKLFLHSMDESKSDLKNMIVCE